MSLDKNKLNQFFKYYENKKLREAASYFYGTLFKAGDNQILNNQPIMKLSKNNNNDSLTILNTYFNYFIQNGANWGPNVTWFESADINHKFIAKHSGSSSQNFGFHIEYHQKEAPSLVDDQPGPNNCYYLGVRLSKDIIEKLKMDKNFNLSWHSINNRDFEEDIDSYLSFNIMIPSVIKKEDLNVQNQVAETTIPATSIIKHNCIDFDTFIEFLKSNLNNNTDPTIKSLFEGNLSAGLNKAALFRILPAGNPDNDLLLKTINRVFVGNNKNNTEGSQSQELSNYNTFTVMQLNAVQKAIEVTINSKEVQESFYKNIGVLLENFEVLKDFLKLTYDKAFTLQVDCKQNQSLKEAQKMGTALSKSIKDDKQTNISNAIMSITIRLLPTKLLLKNNNAIEFDSYEKAAEAYNKKFNPSAKLNPKDVYENFLDFTNNPNIIENINKNYRLPLVNSLNKNKKLNKITYGDSTFNLKYTDVDAPKTTIIDKNTFRMNIIVSKSASKGTVGGVAKKVIKGIVNNL